MAESLTEFRWDQPRASFFVNLRGRGSLSMEKSALGNGMGALQIRKEVEKAKIHFFAEAGMLSLIAAVLIVMYGLNRAYYPAPDFAVKALVGPLALIVAAVFIYHTARHLEILLAHSASTLFRLLAFITLVSLACAFVSIYFLAVKMWYDVFVAAFPLFLMAKFILDTRNDIIGIMREIEKSMKSPAGQEYPVRLSS